MRKVISRSLGAIGRVAISIAALCLLSAYALAQVPSYSQPPVQRPTYSAAVVGLAAPLTGAGDLACVSGFAANSAHPAGILRLKEVTISGIDSTAQTSTLELVKRSTADSGGTAITAPTVVPLDSTDAAGAGAVAAWTAVPTAGTGVGIVSARSIAFNTATSGATIDKEVWVFDPQTLTQEIVLRGTAQSLCVTAPGAFTTAAPALNINFKWSEQ